MLAKRMPLLWVFAGGCLSGATLIHFWRADTEVAPSPTRAAIARTAEAPPIETASAAPAPATPPEHVSAEPQVPRDTDEESPSPADPGHSVADVLARLEAEYRQGLATATPTEPPPSVQQTIAPAEAPAPPPALAPTPAPAAAIAATTVAPAREVPARALPAHEEPAVAVVAAVAHAAPAQDVHVDKVDIGAVHIGDVHRNTQVSYVQQNDAYLLQLQQLALLQNLQLLALSPYARFPASGSPAHKPNGTRRRPPAFPTSLTNPDNPWGFDFPPTILAK
jgi:hypothetical protein